MKCPLWKLELSCLNGGLLSFCYWHFPMQTAMVVSCSVAVTEIRGMWQQVGQGLSQWQIASPQRHHEQVQSGFPSPGACSSTTDMQGTALAVTGDQIAFYPLPGGAAGLSHAGTAALRLHSRTPCCFEQQQSLTMRSLADSGPEIFNISHFICCCGKL